MKSAITIGWRTLVRRPKRLALFVAGVTVAAAMLIDMVMLAEGLQRSLAELLESTGYQVRVTPAGFLPFETGAAIPRSGELVRAFRADPRVDEADPVWGRTLYVTSSGVPGAEEGEESEEAAEHVESGPVAAFGLGIPAGSDPILRIREGGRPPRRGEVLLSPPLAERLGVAIDDTVTVGTEPDAALGGLRRRRDVRVSGIAEFVFSPEGTYSVATPLVDLWALAGASYEPAALILVRVTRDEDAYAVARDFRASATGADVYAIPEIIEAAGDRLTYFQQLSLVLGTVSLGVAFLLVATLLTLSVNERWSEIAALRAIGVTRGRMLGQVAWQGLVIAGFGSLAGLLTGLVIARYLDTILTRFPGLPVEVSFFILRPLDAAVAVGTLVLTGLLAGLYPAWRAASVNIAGALRETA